MPTTLKGVISRPEPADRKWWLVRPRTCTVGIAVVPIGYTQREMRINRVYAILLGWDISLGRSRSRVRDGIGVDIIRTD